MDWSTLDTVVVTAIGVAIGAAIKPWLMDKLGLGPNARPEWYRRQETLQRRRDRWNLFNRD